MNASPGCVTLADEPDFEIGPLRIRPSACRIQVWQDDTRLEAQTMVATVVLARAQGATVNKDALNEACREGRIVSNDAAARTLAKFALLQRG